VKAANIEPVPPLAQNEVDDRRRGYCPACGKKAHCKKGILRDHKPSGGSAWGRCSGVGHRAARPMRQPAKVLAEATKEERKGDERLAEQNGRALGSVICDEDGRPSLAVAVTTMMVKPGLTAKYNGQQCEVVSVSDDGKNADLRVVATGVCLRTVPVVELRYVVDPDAGEAV
jgi:hypothetical protein